MSLCKDFTQHSDPFRPVTHKEYCEFLCDYLKAGGRLSLESLWHPEKPDRLILVTDSVRNFELAKHKDEDKYYLFPNGTWALMSQHMNILDGQEPLKFSKPPIITMGIAKTLKHRNELSPLKHYFNGDIADSLLIAFCLENENDFTEFSNALFRHIIKTHSVDTVEKIVIFNEKMTAENQNHRLHKTMQSLYRFDKMAKFVPETFYRIPAQANHIIARLKGAVELCHRLKEQCDSWEAPDPAPKRPPYKENERELALRIASEHRRTIKQRKGR